ncbi:sodium-coupled monocarboxylate transporter 1-like [Haliotis rubra]|uniref:sodium-coupled monocarboxylate transporter 1-like n=1 Tax=Haliotis rubra TaxID=36100 RepID=UPI001EE51A7A|nr:sodium-coupled monocarboxylate transporter 1-like [Haliotis rubra]
MMSGDGYSILTGHTSTFHTADYVVLAATLSVSAGIGFFYAIKDRNNVSTNEFLLGGRKMNVFPIAMSLLVTFLSALTILGTPSEVYAYNSMFWWICLGFVVATLGAVRIFIPFFYRLGTTSVFEYLEMRFDKSVRFIVSLLFVIQIMLYMSFVLYAPCLALSAVTGLSLWGSVLSVGIVATLYTALGGMKAVVWTDTFQAFIIIAGLVAILIRGSVVMGGFDKAWGDCLPTIQDYVPCFDIDPTTRHSFWSLVVGGGFMWMSLYGVNQAQVQRALSCRSIAKAQVALVLNTFFLIIVISMCCMIGIVMYAFYSDCHPVSFNNLISRTDQTLPLLVMDILGVYPGIPGMFVSSLLSGSLSSISSGLNAVSAVVPGDLIKPWCCSSISDRASAIMSKVIVALSGSTIILLSFAVSRMGTLFQAAAAATSLLNGPIFGIFVLGMFFPWANSKGAIVGSITSVAFMTWIGVGAFVHRTGSRVRSPVFTHGCNWNVTMETPLHNNTMFVTTTTNILDSNTTTVAVTTETSSSVFLPLYSLSYMYYTPTAMAVLVLAGLVTSLLSGPRKPSTLDPRLISPLFDRLFPFLPEMLLQPLRCGVDHDRHKQSYSLPSVLSQDESPTCKPAITPADDRTADQGLTLLHTYT